MPEVTLSATLKANTQQFERDMREAKGALSSLRKGIGQLGDMDLGGVLGTGALVAGIRGVAKEAQQAQIALGLFERQLEINNEGLDRGVELLTQSADRLKTVPDVIADSATLLLRQGLTMNQIVDIFESATASALAVGRTTEQGIHAVTQAIVNQQSVFLNQVGIAENLEIAYRDFAIANNTTVDNLDKTQRAIAAYNIIMRVTQEEVVALDDMLAGLVGANSDLQAAFKRLRLELGDLFLPTVTMVTNAFAGLADLVTGLPRPLLALGTSATTAATAVLSLGAAIRILKFAFAGLGGPAGIILGVAAALGGIVGLSAALARTTEEVEGLTSAFSNIDAPLQTSISRFETARTAINQLGAATSEDGLQGIVDMLAETLSTDLKDAFVESAGAMDLTKESVRELILEYARLDRAALEAAMSQAQTRQQQARALLAQREVLEAQFRAAQLAGDTEAMLGAIRELNAMPTLEILQTRAEVAGEDVEYLTARTEEFNQRWQNVLDLLEQTDMTPISELGGATDGAADAADRYDNSLARLQGRVNAFRSDIEDTTGALELMDTILGNISATVDETIQERRAAILAEALNPLNLPARGSGLGDRELGATMAIVERELDAQQMVDRFTQVGERLGQHVSQGLADGIVDQNIIQARMEMVVRDAAVVVERRRALNRLEQAGRSLGSALMAGIETVFDLFELGREGQVRVAAGLRQERGRLQRALADIYGPESANEAAETWASSFVPRVIDEIRAQSQVAADFDLMHERWIQGSAEEAGESWQEALAAAQFNPATYYRATKGKMLPFSEAIRERMRESIETGAGAVSDIMRGVGLDDDPAEPVNELAKSLERLAKAFEGAAQGSRGFVSDLMNLASITADAISKMVEAEGSTESIIEGLGAIGVALADMLPKYDSLGNQMVEGFFAAGGALAELITGIPGLGQLGAAVGQIWSSVLGDMSNGLKQVNEQIKQTAERSRFLGEELVRQITVTERVSRGGLLGLLGFTKEAVVQEATELAIGIANGIASGLAGAFQAQNLEEFQEKFRDAMRQVIMESVVEAAIMTAEMQQAIADLTQMIVEALADGVITASEKLAIDKKSAALEAEATDTFLELQKLDLLPDFGGDDLGTDNNNFQRPTYDPQIALDVGTSPASFAISAPLLDAAEMMLDAAAIMKQAASTMLRAAGDEGASLAA